MDTRVVRSGFYNMPLKKQLRNRTSDPSRAPYHHEAGDLNKNTMPDMMFNSFLLFIHHAIVFYSLS